MQLSAARCTLQTDQSARVVQENDGLRGNATLTEGNAATLIDSAVQVYCSQYGP
jgi:hypothetical protein